MISVTRHQDFSYGHVLLGDKSQCAQLHGHTSRVSFTCAPNAGDAVGRVVDFDVIRTRLCDWVREHWDHRFLIHAIHPWVPQITKMEGVVVLDFNPTAINMVHYLLYRVGPAMLEDTDVQLIRVRLDETRRATAEVWL